MNERRSIAFLAHVIVTGKGNLNADEQDTLRQLAARYVGVGMRVQRRDPSEIPSDAGFPGGATVPDFAGAISEVNEDAGMVTVELDAPIPVDAGWVQGNASEVTVPAAWLEQEVTAA
jgi:hypothetical protein